MYSYWQSLRNIPCVFCLVPPLPIDELFIVIPLAIGESKSADKININYREAGAARRCWALMKNQRRGPPTVCSLFPLCPPPGNKASLRIQTVTNRNVLHLHPFVAVQGRTDGDDSLSTTRSCKARLSLSLFLSFSSSR